MKHNITKATLNTIRIQSFVISTNTDIKKIKTNNRDTGYTWVG